MDGRGRIAEQVTRLKPRRRPAAASRGFVSRSLRRITLPLTHVRVPRYAGLTACLAFLVGATAYGVVKGDHVVDDPDHDQGRGRRRRQRGRHAHRGRVAVRPASGQPRGDFRRGRRDGTFLAAVPRCRGRAHQARGDPVDRRGDGAQALSGPAADHRHRARGVRAVAAAGQGFGHRRRRHRARREGRAAPCGAAVRRRQRRRRQGARFPCRARQVSGDPRSGARLDPGWRPALEPAPEERHRRAAARGGCRACARDARPLRQGEEPAVARHRRGRSAACRPDHGADVGRARAGARGRAEGKGHPRRKAATRERSCRTALLPR